MVAEETKSFKAHAQRIYQQVPSPSEPYKQAVYNSNLVYTKGRPWERILVKENRGRTRSAHSRPALVPAVTISPPASRSSSLASSEHMQLPPYISPSLAVLPKSNARPTNNGSPPSGPWVQLVPSRNPSVPSNRSIPSETSIHSASSKNTQGSHAQSSSNQRNVAGQYISVYGRNPQKKALSSGETSSSRSNPSSVSSVGSAAGSKSERDGSVGSVSKLDSKSGSKSGSKSSCKSGSIASGPGSKPSVSSRSGSVASTSKPASRVSGNGINGLMETGSQNGSVVSENGSVVSGKGHDSKNNSVGSERGSGSQNGWVVSEKGSGRGSSSSNGSVGSHNVLVGHRNGTGSTTTGGNLHRTNGDLLARDDNINDDNDDDDDDSDSTLVDGQDSTVIERNSNHDSSAGSVWEPLRACVGDIERDNHVLTADLNRLRDLIERQTLRLEKRSREEEENMGQIRQRLDIHDQQITDLRMTLESTDGKLRDRLTALETSKNQAAELDARFGGRMAAVENSTNKMEARLSARLSSLEEGKAQAHALEQMLGGRMDALEQHLRATNTNPTNSNAAYAT